MRNSKNAGHYLICGQCGRVKILGNQTDYLTEKERGIMWIEGINPNRDFPDVNSELLALKGDLNEHDGKLTLARFLRHNLRFTFDMLTGEDFKLYSFQEIMLRAWFNKANNLNILGRGNSKCLDENSIVLTKLGFQKIKDVL